MKNIIDLLGKTVKFVHTENERFFEEQGQITEIVLSLSGEHQISINNNDFYILKNLLEFEIVWKPLFSGMDWDFVNIPRTFAKSAGVVVETPPPSLHLASFYLCRYVASLISTVLNRMGAVIREKSVLAAYCVRSLVDTRSVLTGDLQRKKKQGYTKGTVILVRETLKPP